MSSPDSIQPTDPLAPAIQLETVTARQRKENTEASNTGTDKKSNAEAEPTSK